jgi:N-acetylmuramoyl-L-alanine amidase
VAVDDEALMIPARPDNWAPGRSGHRVDWIVIHCTDQDYASDYPTRLGLYWQRDITWVSAHYGVSDTQVVQYVREADTAWAAGEPANARGVHIELCGPASWKRGQWLRHRPMLAACADLVRRVAGRHAVPLVRLDRQHLARFARGICGHGDTSAVFGDTDHYDPGEQFPWDVLMSLIGDDMTPETVFNVPRRDGGPGLEPRPFKDVIGWIVGKTLEHDHRLEALAEILARVSATGAPPDTPRNSGDVPG